MQVHEGCDEILDGTKDARRELIERGSGCPVKTFVQDQDIAVQSVQRQRMERGYGKGRVQIQRRFSPLDNEQQ